MNLKKLEFAELELVDPNADYSGTQTIFIDFDGASGVSYDNDALNIYINNINIEDSGLSQEEQFKIITDLNHTFADTGVTFTVTAPTNEEYSTIYVGDAGSVFAEYGNFFGLAETIDAGNQIKNDEAFVFSDNINSTITEIITHEAAHLLGYKHESDITVASDINDYADTYEQNFGSSKYTTITISLGAGQSSVSHSFLVDGVFGNSLNSFRTDWYSTVDTAGESGYIESDSSNAGNSYWDPSVNRTYYSTGTYYARGEVMTRNYAWQDFWWKETHQWKVVVVYDNLGPYSVGSLDLESYDDTGSSSSDNITKNDDIDFDWTAPSDRGVDGVASGVKGYYYSLTDSTPDTNDSYTTSTSCTINNILEGSHTLYVRAIDNNGNYGTVKSLSFTIDKTAPGEPNLSSPDNNSNIYDQTPYLNWSSVSGTDYYEIEVYDGDISWGDISDTTSSSNYTPGSNIPLNDTYYWKVRAIDDAGNVGSWSSVRSFYLAGQPDLVTNDIKINNTSNLSSVTIYQGDEVTIDALFKNEGNADSESNVKYKWWWGTSANDRNTQITDGNGNDVDGVVVTGNGFQVNEEEWISTYFSTLNSDPDNWVVNLNPGTYWLTCEIDNPNENNEGENEGNNYRSEQLTVLATPTPDLVTNDIEINGTTDISSVEISQGDEVTLDALFKNEGNADSKSNIKYKWWWGNSENDRNTQITDGGDNSISGVVATWNGLDAESQENEWISEVTFNGTKGVNPDNWKVNLNPGTYWLTCEIDNPNDNNEGENEGNNYRSEQFIVKEDVTVSNQYWKDSAGDELSGTILNGSTLNLTAEVLGLDTSQTLLASIYDKDLFVHDGITNATLVHDTGNIWNGEKQLYISTTAGSELDWDDFSNWTDKNIDLQFKVSEEKSNIINMRRSVAFNAKDTDYINTNLHFVISNADALLGTQTISQIAVSFQLEDLVHLNNIEDPNVTFNLTGPSGLSVSTSGNLSQFYGNKDNKYVAVFGSDKFGGNGLNFNDGEYQLTASGINLYDYSLDGGEIIVQYFSDLGNRSKLLDKNDYELLGDLEGNNDKLIVMVHGWNRTGKDGTFTDNGHYGEDWIDLAENLNTVIDSSDWDLLAYDWTKNASTGGIMDEVIDAPTSSLSTAVAEGYSLAKQIIDWSGGINNLSEIQFISHSAGNWAAIEAGRYLNSLDSNINLQITALDPFVPDPTTYEIYQDIFNSSASVFDKTENYYVYDWKTDNTAYWTSGDYDESWNINRGLDNFPDAKFFISDYNEHAGPIGWYAKTIQNFSETGRINSGLKEDDNILGFGNSLLYEDIASQAHSGAFVCGDFYNDGRADVLWRNQSDGTVGMWGDGVQTNWNNCGIADINAWEIVGVGDFYNDGKDDVLWRNQSNGTVGMWGDGVQTNWNNCGIADINAWEIVGVGDFYNDGKDDVLWRNQSDGTVGMWGDGVQSQWNNCGIADINAWEIVGVGDFYNDSQDDVLWRNKSDGTVGMWGDGVQSNWNETGSADINAWEIVGVGDFYNDGKDDVLWRNKSDGTVGMWGDGVQTSWNNCGIADVNTWKIVGVGDFYNDGKDDILWRNQSNGDVGMWGDGVQTSWQGTGSADINTWAIC